MSPRAEMYLMGWANVAWEALVSVTSTRTFVVERNRFPETYQAAFRTMFDRIVAGTDS